MDIKNLSGDVVYSCDAADTRTAAERAVREGANLGGAFLGGADLRGADLQEADLRRANLRGANLRGANLRGANLDGADLGGAYLRGAYLSWANLRGATYGPNVPLTREPLQLLGLHWDILILDHHIEIGCELHSTDEWRAFDAERIALMDPKALEWWRSHRELVLAAAAAHQEE